MKGILFCGSYIPQSISGQVKHNSQAGNNFQHEIIEELKKGNTVEVLSYIGYPLSEEMKLLQETPHKDIYYVIKCLYKNFPSIYIAYYKLFKNLLKDKKCVILYNYNYINLLINYFCRRTNIKTVLIIADHSEPYEYGNPVRRVLARRYAKDYRKFDRLIFLSEKLMERYKHKNKMLLEGGINLSRFKDFSPSPVSDKFIVCYSGLLSNITGVDLLLDTINRIEDRNIDFVFSGKGEMAERLKQCAVRDQRIKYVGFLSEEAYLQQIDNANILLNPRNMDLPQNQNNFPSKVLDYLAAGKVIISTPFPGHEKFSDNVLFCEPTPESLAKAITNAIIIYKDIYTSQFNKNRVKATEFDWKSQVMKIEKFIES